MAAKLVVAALIVRGDEILICRRSADGPMPLKWEFPGGKVEPNESPAAALARELQEELAIGAEVGEQVARVLYEYKDGFYVELLFFRVDRYEGELRNLVFADVRWERLENLGGYDFLEADLELIRDLAVGKVL